MKKMKNNKWRRMFISAMFVFALCVTTVMLIGLPVEAGVAEWYNDVPNEAAANKAVSLIVNGTEVTDAKGVVTEHISDTNAGWRYDADTNTLTLENAVINKYSNRTAGIYYDGGDLIIKLIGKSSIDVKNTAAGTIYTSIIPDSNAANLYIVGEGTLETTGIIQGTDGMISVSDGAMLKTQGLSSGAIKIIKSSVVTNDANTERAISSKGNVIIQESNITVEGNTIGIYSGGALQISDSQITINAAVGINTTNTPFEITNSILDVTVSGYALNAFAKGKITNSFVKLHATKDYLISAQIPALTMEKSQVLCTSDGTPEDRSSDLLLDSLYLYKGKATLSGDVTLIQNVELPSTASLTIPEGSALNIPEGVTLSAQGDIVNNGTLTVDGILELPANTFIYDVKNLGITGTGGIKFGNAYIDTQGNCITHNWEEGIRKKDTSSHYTKYCTICYTSDEATVAACEYDNICDTDCNICQGVRTVTHQYNENGLCPLCCHSNIPGVDSDGDGYVEIDTAAKLWWFTQQVNSGSSNRSLNAELTADIDLSDTYGEYIGNWVPISNSYQGHFNGQGYTVSGLYMTGNDLYVGLFGYVSGATIENLGVTGSVDSACVYLFDKSYDQAAAGGIVAYLEDGTIRNCQTDMTVRGANYIGGICGWMENGLIEGCSARGEVTINLQTIGGGLSIGGIVGDKSGGIVRSCVNQASINSGSNPENSAYLGGIVGMHMRGAIENCLNYGTISGQDVAGGIVGNNAATIRNCGNQGTITLTCEGTWSGSIAGIHQTFYQTDVGLIENSYSVGTITVGSGTAGSIFGDGNNNAGEVRNAYYLSDIVTEDGGRTAEQFASGQVTYELNGSVTNENSVWLQTLGTDSYPVLSGEQVYCVTPHMCNGTALDAVYSNSSVGAVVHNDSDGDGSCDDCKAIMISATTFPDTAFRNYIAGEAIDQNQDGVLSGEEIEAVTSIDVNSLKITDLTGLGYFTNLENLIAGDIYYLRSIDVSTLTKLKILDLIGCYKLESLDVSALTALDVLSLENCLSLRSLDLTKNKALRILDVSSCVLKELDLSANTALEVLDISLSSLTNIDLSNNPNVSLIGGTACTSSSFNHCGLGAIDMGQFGDISKMRVTSGGYLLDDGWLEFDSDNTPDAQRIEVVYQYDTGKEGCVLEVTLYINITGAHSYEQKLVTMDNASHYTEYCAICRTGKEDTVQEHNFGEYSVDAEYHQRKCGDCGFVLKEQCTYQSACEEKCSVCELHTRYSELHKKIYEPRNDEPYDNGHWIKCENCSYVASGVCKYEFECTENCICDRENPNVKAHTEQITNESDGTHDKVCSVCAKVLAEDIGCDYKDNIDTNCIAALATCISGTTYYKSCSCGKKSNETFVDDVLNPDAHAGKDNGLITKGDGTHNVVYSCCKVVITENVACTPADCTKASSCACGYDMEAAYSEHDFSGEYLYNDNGHWKKCQNCEVTSERNDHYGQSQNDCMKPTLCECGYVVMEAQGHRSEGSIFHNETYHYEGCAYCTLPVNDIRIPHDFSVPEKDEYEHWNKCSGCEYTDEHIPHSRTDNSDCTKDSSCTCGYVMAGNACHTYVDKVVNKDKTGHYARSCEFCEMTDEGSFAEHNIEYLAAGLSQNHRVSCTECGYSENEACTDTDSNYRCDMCNTYLGYFQKANISLGEDIAVKYYVAKGELSAPEIRFTINDYTKIVKGELSGEYFKFVFEGVAPQWIGDNIKAELLVNGEVIETQNYSVLEYVNSLKSKTASELGISETKYEAMQNLIANLLVYAGAAQKYTGYNADTLVSDGIVGTEYQTLTAPDGIGVKNGDNVRFTSANVWFNSVNKLAFKFTATDLDCVTFKLKINDSVETVLDKANIIDNGDGTCTIMTDAIKAVGFDDVYTLTVYNNSDDTTQAKIVYSVKYYVYINQNGTDTMAELAKATYNYGLSAKVYGTAN